MATWWMESETRALLGIWNDESVQQKLSKVSKKKPIYNAITKKLNEMGYTKTGEQCETKTKNLLATYRKVKDNHRTSGSGADTSFPLFDETDAVLGTKATSKPLIVSPCHVGNVCLVYRMTTWEAGPISVESDPIHLSRWIT